MAAGRAGLNFAITNQNKQQGLDRCDQHIGILLPAGVIDIMSKYRIMHGLEWRSGKLFPREGHFDFDFSSCEATRKKTREYHLMMMILYLRIPEKHSLSSGSPSVRAYAVRHKSTYNILFLTRYKESINDVENDGLHTSIPSLTRSVYVLLMTSQAIADDVTNALHDATIIKRGRGKRYLAHQIWIVFTAIFTNGHGRSKNTVGCKCLSMP